MDQAANKIPITIVTGCLGSGKTTLLLNVLNDPSYENCAVIVNEFGKVGLDHHLLRMVEEKTSLLNNGCICCNSREDLVEELKSLLFMDEARETQILDRVVIETTGVADPSPILFTVLTDPVLQHHFFIDCVVSTVDAVNGMLHLTNNPEMIKQITAADKVVITKTDLASDQDIQNIKVQLTLLNPSAELYKAVNGHIDSDILIGKVRTDQKERMKNIEDLQSEFHGSSMAISTLSLQFKNTLDWTAFGLWLSMLLHANGERVLRVKGLLDVNEEGPIVLNGVQHIIHPPIHLKEWINNEKTSSLIFILREINPNEIIKSLKGFQQFLGTDVELIEAT